jgi:hypothetical protein
MDKHKLYKLLKTLLSLDVEQGWVGSQKVLSVKLLFDGEEIASDKVTLEYDDDF